MAPLIPYISLPEIPLGFMTKLPDSAIGAILGATVALVAGSALLADMRNKALSYAVTACLMVIGGLIGYTRAPHLLDTAHPPSIKPFGTLVALGVYIGSVVAMGHARERGLSEKKMSEFIFWVVGIGFIGGHMLDAVFYHPNRLAKDPLYLFMLWEGLSSYGGFIGAIVGAFAWKLRRGEPILGFCEVVNSAFPLAWVFGRAGCASVHDHPGRLSDAWFAVRWPIFGGETVGRLDLGLIEMTLTVPLAVAFLVLWRRKPDRPLGFYSGLMCVSYAPVRFFLDFLREEEKNDALGGDPRYAGLTPAQWACFGLLAVGIYFLRIWWKNREAEAQAGEAAPAVLASEDLPTLDPSAFLTVGAAAADGESTEAFEAGTRKKRKKKKKPSEQSTALERKPPSSADGER